MAPNENIEEPTERTSLLSKDAPKVADPSLSGNGSSNGTAAAAAGEDTDIESGTIGPGDGGQNEEGNPLFEGHKTTRMSLLIPAVAVGILLSAADQTLVVTSYGRIGSDLEALNNTSWIAAA